jgi:hypothetical protein
MHNRLDSLKLRDSSPHQWIENAELNIRWDGVVLPLQMGLIREKKPIGRNGGTESLVLAAHRISVQFKMNVVALILGPTSKRRVEPDAYFLFSYDMHSAFIPMAWLSIMFLK